MNLYVCVISVIAALCIISPTNAIRIAASEFDPTTTDEASTNATEVHEQNVKMIQEEMDKYMTQMDVIVFPEYAITGLTGEYAKNGIHVPRIEAETADYQSIIKRLSNIALEHGKYVIVHLVENATDNHLYSTAVVFNKEGQIIGKHRKLSLSTSERSNGLTAGNTTTIVEIEQQNYAVMFGEDLFTIEPPSSTDSIIVLSSLVNAIPYESALSLYAAYALKNHKNLIVSGLNSPSTGRSGTGVFLYTSSNNSLSVDSYVTGKTARYEIFGDVTAQTVVKVQQTAIARGMPGEDALEYLAYVKKSNLKTNQKLNVENEKQIAHKHFACNLVNVTSSGDLSSNYKFVQQTGTWTVGNTTYATAFCGIVVYANNSDSTFGQRIKSALTINSINLNLTLLLDNATVVYPIGLDYNLKPISSLTFKRNVDNNRMDISATQAADVLTLGYLVLTDSSGAAFGVGCNLLVLLATLVLARYF